MSDKAPDLKDLTFAQREVVLRLVDAYPDHVVPERLCKRLADYGNGEIGDWHGSPSTVLCAIRRLLGDEAIESVWSYRTNRKGREVRDLLLGYRLGARLATEWGLVTRDPIIAAVAEALRASISDERPDRTAEMLAAIERTNEAIERAPHLAKSTHWTPDREEFIRVWSESDSMARVAEHFGVAVHQVMWRSNVLRKEGVALAALPRNTGKGERR